MNKEDKMAEQDKGSRRQLKRLVTIEGNMVKRLIAEDRTAEEVTQRTDKLKQRFQDLLIVHERYTATLDEETDIDESDRYFTEVQDAYVKTLDMVNAWCKGKARDSMKESAMGGTTPAVGDIGWQDLLKQMNLPRVEIEAFNGDPLNYHSFMAVFDESVEKVTGDGQLKLTRLLQYTSYKAKDAIRSCALIGGDRGYRQARKILDEQFGNVHLVSERIVRELVNGTAVRSPDELRQLSNDLVNAEVLLKQMKRYNEVNSQRCINDIVNRVQPYVKNRWRRHALDMLENRNAYPDFGELVNFIRKVANEASDPVYGQVSATGTKNNQEVYKRKSNTSGASFMSAVRERTPCPVCGEDHRVIFCEKFKMMNLEERIGVVKSHRLCNVCLIANHFMRECKSPYKCSLPGCGKRHSRLIHINVNRGVNISHSVNVSRDVHFVNSSVIQMPIVPVRVNYTYNTFALLDTASSNSFCTQRLVDALGLKGRDVKYLLSTLNQRKRKESCVVTLNLESIDGGEALGLQNIYVVDEIPATTTFRDVRMYEHLKGISFAGAEGNEPVDILIGQDYTEALVPLEVRKGKRGEPFATRTLFGWSLNGKTECSRRPVSASVVSNFVTTRHSTASLEDQVKMLWMIENEGISDDIAMSQEDNRVLRLWENEIRHIEGHYELPVPWKNADAAMPNNVSPAISRLQYLSKSLQKKGLMERYDTEINKLLASGYAEEVPLQEVSQQDKRIWYLPHHGVITDKKPGKLRVVFDCAAKYEGESLNDKCLQGPDLNNKLMAVLLNFRLHSYGIMADVEAMYNQVRVPAKDRDSLRFLWYKDGRMAHFRMTSHLFGGVWCASSATFALRQTATDDKTHGDDIKDIIYKNFYVDDCLKSVKDKEEARRIIKQCKLLLGQGGFNLTKFVKSDPGLLSEIPEGDRAKEVKDLNLNAGSKVLGIKWDITTDDFYFEVKKLDDGTVTRRKMLSLVSSIFDPLGLVSPLVMTGKIIFQDATRLKLNWDDEVPPDIGMKWKSWLIGLKDMGNVRVPRCVKPRAHDDAVIEWHHFSDASQRAYGCCSYLRCINRNGEIQTALVMSRHRVAPMKQHTIPRLELQAATLSAKMSSVLEREVDIDTAQSYFWTDSEIVLKYIRNETKRFQVYIENRVSVIRRITDKNQWHYIEGERNPADMVTKGQTMQGFDMIKWFEGPPMLRRYKNEWKVKQTEWEELLVNDTDLGENPTSVSSNEVKETVSSVAGVLINITDRTQEAGFGENSDKITRVREMPLDKLLAHYSSWYRLKRAVAWWLRVIERLRPGDVRHDRHLTVAEVLNAEKVIIRHVQGQCYPKEVMQLAKDNEVSKRSFLRSLTPFIDQEGIIRVGGRLTLCPIDTTHPCILPYSHPVALLIVRDAHDIAHLGTEWVLSVLRRKFWIIKARVIIKRVSGKCVTCKKLYTQPPEQKMADLPPVRVGHGDPPFTHVGMDVSGLFYAKVSRAEVKRYGCVFTCLTTRAIHIERLNNLGSDTFINCLRRFMSRRGKPHDIFCDNGTNFVGAHGELKRSLKHLSDAEIQAYCVKNEVTWFFNPPSASHMGGVWERMIRTIRKVLNALLNDCGVLSDEVIDTLFCEVESIINGRPLTKVSDDVTDASPLTPNHLLLLRDGPKLPPGRFLKGDAYRKRWRHVQYLADQFWNRWIKQYLPELQRRCKWTHIKPNLKIGDLVLVVNENTPRNLWPLALIVDIKEGRDRLVRSVRLRTRATTIVRPISKLVPLEI